jgi:hypothetical protein
MKVGQEPSGRDVQPYREELHFRNWTDPTRGDRTPCDTWQGKELSGQETSRQVPPVVLKMASTKSRVSTGSASKTLPV